MSNLKMSASYKAIFILSILMVFVVLIVGAATKSKTSGVGMWIWGYTAWLMYKRRISDLVSFYKTLLWFDIVMAAIALVALAFSESDVSRYVEHSSLNVILLFTVVISLTYGLYKYFFNLQTNPSLNSPNGNTEADYWEQVSIEIKYGKRIDSLWTRAFSEADGDKNKANARYIKLRIEQLKSQRNNDVKTPRTNNFNIKFSNGLMNYWDQFNNVGKFAIVGFLILGSILFYDNYIKVVDNSSLKIPANIPIVKDIKVEKCYIYWDGVKFQLGKTEGDKFARYVKDFYGVERLEFALPKEMANYITPNSKVGDKVTEAADKFLNLHWIKIEQLCNF